MFKRKGFTLIELLIVMAVIAILIAIAIPSFRGMQQEARKSKAQGDVRVLKIAVESYYKNNGSYPTAEATLLGASPKILEQTLYDPFAGTGSNTEYLINISSNGSYYVIRSVGTDSSATITGISNTGTVEGSVGDDVYETNGTKQ